MPEGDTIHRTAWTLRKAVAGQRVVDYRAYRPALAQPTRVGRTVDTVEARGKNLLIFFDDGYVLYSHMKMTGSWHVYRPGEPWRKPAHYARIVLKTEPYVAVCFSAPVIELLTEPALLRHSTLSALGPDLMSDNFDVAQALPRFHRAITAPLGVAVMDQRIVAGIGNVYKSEVLFLTGLNPFAAVCEVPAQDLRRFLQHTKKHMHANFRTFRRTLRRGPGPRMWVYNRSGAPCLKCGTKIAMRRQGDMGRSTYFCPACQNVEPR